MNRDELIETYGQPQRLEDRISGEVLVFLHKTREAAEAYANANNETYGYPCDVEPAQGWLSIVDLRPAIAEIEKNWKDGGHIED